MPAIERDGAHIHYEVSGAGEPMLLGHSLLCDGRMWDEVAPALAAHYRLINVDFRGHRHSTAPRPYTLEDLAGDWLAILDAEGLDRAILCGLSMGGMTAMRLALSAPDRVRGMVLIDSSADAETARNRVKYRLMAEVYKRVGLNRLLQRSVLPLMFGPRTLTERPELARRFVDRVADHRRDHLYQAIMAVTRRGNLLPRLRHIRAPALVLVGTEDRATPPKYSEQLEAGLPDSRLEHIPDAGHLSAVEQPDLIARAILEWGQVLPP
jgi:3-oxoadipate enol-lactonase